MKLNLQFFAEEEVSAGAEATEPAELSETVDEGVNTEATEGNDSPEGAQTSPEENNGVDMNAIYAQVRRKVEAEAKRKQDARDAMVAKKYGNYVNPETGRAILTEADYWEAMAAQERVQTKQKVESKLQDAGITQDDFNRMIANSPQMQEAERKMQEAENVLQEFRRQQIEKLIDDDIAELNKMNPNITSLATVPVEVRNNAEQKGISLVLAYKDLYFGKVNAQQASTIQQRTINQIAGKSHLAPVAGVAQKDNLVEIPADKLASWKKLYPNLSATELKKKYNNGLR